MTDVLDRPAPPPDRTVAYGTDPHQVADVWDNPGRPRVLFVHGGFWRAVHDRRHARPLAADLAARGYAVTSVEYRRVGQPGGGWPGTLDDVALAVDTFGADVLVGHSAGGHLALWAGARRGIPVVALAPVADVYDAYREGTGDGAVVGLLGGGPDEHPDRYAAAQPGDTRRAILVHGVEDDEVPVTQSRAYARRTGAGIVELPGTGHFEVIDPQSAVWSHVVHAISTLCS